MSKHPSQSTHRQIYRMPQGAPFLIDPWIQWPVVFARRSDDFVRAAPPMGRAPLCAPEGSAALALHGSEQCHALERRSRGRSCDLWSAEGWWFPLIFGGKNSGNLFLRPQRWKPFRKFESPQYVENVARFESSPREEEGSQLVWRGRPRSLWLVGYSTAQSFWTQLLPAAVWRSSP